MKYECMVLYYINFIDLVPHTVGNDVCGFYFHVCLAVTDEIKALLRPKWSDSLFSLVLFGLKKKEKMKRRKGEKKGSKGIQV